MVNRGEKKPALISFPLLPPWFCVLECRLRLKRGWRMAGHAHPFNEDKRQQLFHSAVRVLPPTPLNSLTIILNCDFQQGPEKHIIFYSFF